MTLHVCSFVVLEESSRIKVCEIKQEEGQLNCVMHHPGGPSAQFGVDPEHSQHTKCRWTHAEWKCDKGHEHQDGCGG